MALHCDYTNPFKRADIWATKEKYEYYDNFLKEILNLSNFRCQCEEFLKVVHYEDYYAPMSDAVVEKCSDPVCPNRATILCTFCDEVLCNVCVKKHCVSKKHHLKIQRYIMPFPATGKTMIPCYNCRHGGRISEYFCTQSQSFVCSTCNFFFHPTYCCKIIKYINNEMKLEVQPHIIWNGSHPYKKPNGRKDSGRVPLPKPTSSFDHTSFSTPASYKVMFKNQAKYNLLRPIFSEHDPLVCACCGRKAETSVKCVLCKRSYHPKCHIPELPEETTDGAPTKKWKCTMCVDIAKTSCAKTSGENASQDGERLPRDVIEMKITERILMELYCRGQDSQHYEECPVRQKHPQYYKMIADPVSLNDVRYRLKSGAYSSVGDAIKDLKRVFSNGMLYYRPGDARRNAALNLMDSMKTMLRQWLPALVL